MGHTPTKLSNRGTQPPKATDKGKYFVTGVLSLVQAFSSEMGAYRASPRPQKSLSFWSLLIVVSLLQDEQVLGVLPRKPKTITALSISTGL